MTTPNTTKRDHLAAAIIRHGQSLLAAFPNAAEQDPDKLCRKLRRVETVAHQFATDCCNGDIQEDEDAGVYFRHYGRGTAGPFQTEKTHGPEWFLAKVRAILGLSVKDAERVGLFLNRDARGYALKLSDEWTRNYNRIGLTNNPPIYSDWGGYGILAPDLREGA
jgi:hypothetical protein